MTAEVRSASRALPPLATRAVPTGPRGPLDGRAGRALLLISLLGCAAGAGLGVVSGPLWLDETLSVDISRLPLLATGPDSLYDGLRQDGAPPLYYLLLRGWTDLFGTGTATVRLLSVLLAVVALLLVLLLARQAAGLLRRPDGAGVTPRTAGRAAVAVLACLPWTMRYGSEARMYQLVVVLVLAGALALLRLRRTGSWADAGLVALAATALLYTHYWALFLLAAVGAASLPGLLRRDRAAVQLVAAVLAAGVAFLPWVPTLLFQAGHTGAPWATPTTFADLLLTPTLWGGDGRVRRLALGAVVLGLAIVAARRVRPFRAAGAVVLMTMLLAWTSVAISGGAYTDRYTAVVVPFVALLVAAGALTLPGRRPLVALLVVVALGLSSGIAAAERPRTAADLVVQAYEATATPDQLLLSCPDQMAPDVQRLLPASVTQIVYPTLEPAGRIDWVDYAARQEAADPVALARRASEIAGDEPMYLLMKGEYRTFDTQCETVRGTLVGLRGRPTLVYGRAGSDRQQLWRYSSPR